MKKNYIIINRARGVLKEEGQVIRLDGFERAIFVG